MRQDNPNTNTMKTQIFSENNLFTLYGFSIKRIQMIMPTNPYHDNVKIMPLAVFQTIWVIVGIGKSNCVFSFLYIISGR